MSTFRVETYYYQGNERQVRTVEVEADDMLIVGENEVNLSILAFRDKKRKPDCHVQQLGFGLA